MLAGGGESCTDIESLAAQGRLFGDVCSDTTLYRTFTDSLDGDTLVRARHAIGRIRGEVWERIPAVTGGDDPVILDIDASLVERACQVFCVRLWFMLSGRGVRGR